MSPAVPGCHGDGGSDSGPRTRARAAAAVESKSPPRFGERSASAWKRTRGDATAREELADELKRFLAGEPIVARPVSRPERFALARWEPFQAAPIATILLAIGCGTVVEPFYALCRASRRRPWSSKASVRAGSISSTLLGLTPRRRDGWPMPRNAMTRPWPVLESDLVKAPDELQGQIQQRRERVQEKFKQETSRQQELAAR